MKAGDKVYVAAGVNIQAPDGKLTSVYVVAVPMTLVRMDAEAAELLPPAEWQDRLGWPPVHLTHPKFLFDTVKAANDQVHFMSTAARAKGVPLYCSYMAEPAAGGGQ